MSYLACSVINVACTSVRCAYYSTTVSQSCLCSTALSAQLLGEEVLECGNCSVSEL